MTIKRVGKLTNFDVQKLIGLSTDSKPINVDPGSTFYELDTTNSYQFDGIAWQQKVMVYKDLSQIITATNMAAGATVYSNVITGLQWVRNILTLGQSDQQFDIGIVRIDTQGIADFSSALSTAIGSTTLWAPRPSVVILGYSAKFYIKNSSASANTVANLRVQLMGL